jgi:subtilase family serine protease
MLNRSRGAIASVLLLSGVAAVAACSSGQSDPSRSVAGGATATSAIAALPGLDVPAWATSARYAGRLDTSATLSVQVHLRMQDIDGARAALAEVSNPKSARYGQFLDDATFAAKYGPPTADVAAVRAHLEKYGLHVTAAPANGAFLTAEGSAAQVEQAFATRLGTYVVNGVKRHAPLDVAALPADISSRVSAVLGLSTPGKAKPALVKPITLRPTAGPSDGTVPPNGCSTYWGQYDDTTDPPYGGGFASPTPYGLCNGYVPPQVRKMYGMDEAVRTGIDGRGQTIAIIDAWESPTVLQDAQQYATNNDPDYPLPASQFTEQYAPGTPVSDPSDQAGWAVEEGLDVEAVHAMAPKANIAFVAGQSDSDDDLIAALNFVITNHVASVVSNSWGEYEFGEDPATVTAYEQVLLQGSLKGIGFYFASGDNGDQALIDEVYGTPTGPTASFPSSLPEVTSVGGTSVAFGQHDDVLFELGWETGVSLLYPVGYDGSWLDWYEGNPDPVNPGDGGPTTLAWWPAPPGGYYFGSGGGPSVLFAQPWYQQGVVPGSLARADGKAWRVQPDVGMLGDPYTGYQVGETYGGTYAEFPVGGTSLATPLFTASIALAQQFAGRHFGAANPLIYLAAQFGGLRDIAPTHPGQAVAFPGTTATFDYHGPENTLATARGFDDVTGLGSVNGVSFLNTMGLLGQ